MTALQYKNALKNLGLTQAAAASFLKVSVRTSNGYANGSAIPEGTAKLLRLMISLELQPKDVR